MNKNNPILNSYASFDYASLQTFLSTERTATINQDFKRKIRNKKYQGIKAIVQNDRSIGFVSTNELDMDREHLISRASRLSKYSSPLDVQFEKVNPSTPFSLSKIPAKEEDFDFLREIGERLLEKHVKHFNVYIRRSQSSREFDDSFGSKHLLNNEDFIVTITALSTRNKKFTMQYDAETFQFGEVCNFVETFRRYEVADPYHGALHLPIVLSPTAAAGLIHELIGHVREADLSENISDCQSHRQLNVWNDPLNGGKRAGHFIDEDGIKAKKSVLLKDGRFHERLHSIHTAAVFNEIPNGNGFSLNVEGKTIPRQSYLGVEPVSGNKESFIKEIRNGLYLTGHVNGKLRGQTILLHTQLGYVINNGRLTTSIRDLALEVDASRLLQSILGIGTDLEDVCFYSCNKYGVRIPVNFSVPSLFLRMDDGGRL